MKRNFHIFLGNLALALCLLLSFAGGAQAVSYTVCPGVGVCDKTTPQAAFDELAIGDGDTLTITGDYSDSTLDLSAVDETGTIYIVGPLRIGTIVGKAGLSLVGNGTTINVPTTLTLGNAASLHGFRIAHVAATASYVLLVDGTSKFLLVNGVDKLIRP